MPLLHHLALTASDLQKSVSFYDGLMGHFGYRRAMTTEKLAAWEGPDFELLLYPAKPELRSRQHEIYQPGLHHLAFRVTERADVDRVFEWLLTSKADILDAPRLYPEYSDAYYAVFFRDPDSLKVEVLSV